MFPFFFLLIHWVLNCLFSFGHLGAAKTTLTQTPNTHQQLLNTVCHFGPKGSQNQSRTEDVSRMASLELFSSLLNSHHCRLKPIYVIQSVAGYFPHPDFLLEETGTGDQMKHTVSMNKMKHLSGFEHYWKRLGKCKYTTTQQNIKQRSNAEMLHIIPLRWRGESF